LFLLCMHDHESAHCHSIQAEAVDDATRKIMN
jgi:hypothetical protein